MSVLLRLAALGLVAWGLLDPRFRDAEGIPTGAICLPVSLAATSAVLALAWRTSWRKPGLWLALALAGQAVSLQLIDAGPRLHYQHYQTLSWILAYQPWHLLFLVCQTILVARGFRGRWGAVLGWLSRHLRWWQIAGVAAVFWLTAATVSEDKRRYVIELAFAAFLQTVSLGNVVLFAWSLPKDAVDRLRERLRRWLEPSASAGGLDPFAIGAALWVTSAAAFLNVVSYERHPHIPDEVVYLIHARYFAQGKLSLPAPPVPEAFEVDLMDLEGDRWFSSVPPGWPAVLAIGVLLGVPWLVNPVLAGVNTLGAWYLIRELYDPRVARLTALLLAVSPWHVFMGMNFMTHTATLTCGLAVGIGLLLAQRRRAWLGGLLAGLGSGWALLIRPLEGFILGLFAAGWIGASILRRRVSVVTLMACATAGILLSVSALAYNRILTGDPLRFPIMAYTDERYGPNANALGFGPDRGMGWPLDPNPGHSLFDALVNSNLNLFSMNIELFGWSTGSLLLLAVFLMTRKWRPVDAIMLAVCVAVFTAHLFYFYSGGPDFGARYWFLMLVPCIVFAIHGMDWLGGALGLGKDVYVMLAVASLALMALVNYFPWRAVDKYHHFEYMRPDVRELSCKHNFGRSLVLVRGQGHPDYASAAAYNPLDWHAPAPLYAWDRSAEARRRVVEAYSDRPVWIVEGPSLTGQGFRVVAGPVQSSELLAAETNP
ncbi:MAG: glycosyltransferase family 39 protein [Bryobacterales bacterium]|nr:glycosyltransferase family 39 protein [Bryobacteraceae bacterium]MDW8352970.1 glycosyltransferase family 39 protein [Bryobacterales bacterium]